MPFLQRDGIALYYEKTDGAAPPVVLIHGWCCDHTYFAAQVDHFARLGLRVMAMDLRGHGKSDKPQQSYAIQVFADDVAWMCGKLQLMKPILIGHSMGGIIAFDIAARYPDLPAAIVMLDSAVAVTAASHAAMPPFMDRVRGLDYPAAVRDYVVQTLFIPADDARRKAAIVEGMLTAPQHMMISAFEGLYDYDASIGQGCIVAPSLYIAANEPSPRSDMTRLRAIVPHMSYGQTVESGHFCQLEVPEQINAMIDRFLASALTPRDRMA